MGYQFSQIRRFKSYVYRAFEKRGMRITGDLPLYVLDTPHGGAQGSVRNLVEHYTSKYIEREGKRSCNRLSYKLRSRPPTARRLQFPQGAPRRAV